MLWPYGVVGLGLYLGHSAWLAMGGYHLGLLVVVLGVIRRFGGWPELCGRKLVRVLVGATCLASLLAGMLLTVLWSWLVSLSPAGLEAFLLSWGITAQGWSWFGWYFCLVNPWAEELYWRYWLGHTSHAAWETSAWFAGYHGLVLLPLLHWGWVVPVLLILTITGWWWDRLMKLGSGLTGPILCHLAADASIILAVTYQLS